MAAILGLDAAAVAALIKGLIQSVAQEVFGTTLVTLADGTVITSRSTQSSDGRNRPLPNSHWPRRSRFGSTLTRLGLRNAWTEGTQFSFLAPVPVERLATMPDARLVIVGAVPPEARRALSRSVLWQALPQVAERRVHHLPEVNAFGGVPAALRFARLLSQALAAGSVAGI